MDVATISMPADAARAKYDEYREAIRGNPNVTKEDRAILMGYKSLAGGRSILNLFDSFRATGVDSADRPRLAVVRADFARVYCRFYWTGRCEFNSHARFRAYRGQWKTELPDGVLPRHRQYVECTALVPIIPVPLRPKDDLARYHVLWEADWQAVPTDPMLLRHLSGSLYTVLAVWDLTSLERAVLAGRLTESR
jgi:hypothetical protein